MMALAMVKNQYMEISPIPSFSYEHFTSWYIERRFDFWDANLHRQVCLTLTDLGSVDIERIRSALSKIHTACKSVADLSMIC